MYAGIHSVTKCSNRTLNDLSPVYTEQTSLRSKCKKEGERGRGGGGEKNGRGRVGKKEGKGALTTKAHITPCFYVQNLDVKC